MNRRELIVFSGSAAGMSVLGRSALSDEATPRLPQVYEITPNKEITLSAYSTPVIDGDFKLSIIHLGTCSLTLDDHGHLKAKVKAGIAQYAKVEYWISLAVFNSKDEFLGAATHKELVQFIRLGRIPTHLPELEFDFGISNSYKSVARLAVAISERDVPKPGQG